MAETIVIISGPSGVGKSTVARLAAEQTGAFLSVSVTTRPKRPGEIDGRDYHFITTEQMEKLIADGAVLEYARVYGGHYYGTPAAPVREALAAGRPVILEIEIEGTLQVKRVYPQAIGVYMLAPTSDEQRSRLQNRRQDSDAAIAERLSKAREEIERARRCGAYTHFLINERIEETVRELVSIIKERQAQ